MPDRKPIHSFFCWLVATVLLGVTMGSFPRDYPLPSPEIEQVENSQSPGDENTAGQPTVSELSLDAVVIALFSYHFSSYTLPAPQAAINFPERSCRAFSACFSEPLFFFCYFQKVFGKQIAANAP